MDTARLAGCGQAADWLEYRRALDSPSPKLRAEERIRGLEKATKSFISFCYLGLRVARAGGRVNA
jgi:hypothetical protein